MWPEGVQHTQVESTSRWVVPAWKSSISACLAQGCKASIRQCKSSSPAVPTEYLPTQRLNLRHVGDLTLKTDNELTTDPTAER